MELLNGFLYGFGVTAGVVVALGIAGVLGFKFTLGRGKKDSG